MKSSSPSSLPADEQASLWAARLDGSVLSADDRANLDRWLAADPGHRALLSAYCQFSADLEQQLPLIAGARDELAETTTAIPRAAVSSSPWWRRPAWAGATLAAAAALAVFLWPDQPQNQFQNLGTPVAARHSFTLSDGSTVELNAQTAVAIDLGATERRVRLSGGEAFFRVAKDDPRPFYVETSAGSVRVTGTEFNVRTESPDQLEVTVLEGAVQVRPGADAALRALRAGDRLVADASGVDTTSLSRRELDDMLAWRQGQIVFHDTPLREALARYARYHGRTITVADSVALQRVGSRFSLDDLDGFLATLEDDLQLARVTRGRDGTIHVTAVSER